MRNSTYPRRQSRRFSLATVLAMLLLILNNSSAFGASREPSPIPIPYAQSKRDKLAEALRLADQAALLRKQGRYDEAIPIVERWLAIVEKALGPRDPNVATALNNLGTLYQDKGDYAKAEPIFKRALAIRENAVGPGHPDVAKDLNNLAALYYYKGDHSNAEPLYLRALAIVEKALGPWDELVAALLNNLGQLYKEKGDYLKAEPLYERALAIDEKVLGQEHPSVATALGSLAELYRAKGEYLKAVPLYQRALAIDEKVLGPKHPAVAIALGNFSLLYEAQGVIAKAVALRTRAADISEQNIALNLTIGSERQKLSYLATYSIETNGVVKLHMSSAPRDPSALRLALTTVLRRKGRALDAMAESIAALRRRMSPEQQALLDQLTDARAQLASIVLGGLSKKDPAKYRADTKTLEDRIEGIEDRVSRLSAQYRAQTQPVTIETVQAAIPADAALVEFVSYYPVKQNRREPRRYAAYVLGNRGQPGAVDLGPAAEIDRGVSELRALLRKDENKPLSDVEREVKPKARALDQRIMQPVRKLIGDKRKLLLSPDGTLSLLPFAALVDEQNKYLVETYSLTYLTTGRDLLRLQTRMESKQGTVVFANPDFGAYQQASSGRAVEMTKGNSGEQPNARSAIDFSRAFFGPLPGTAAEAQALRTIFPDATVLALQQATESALKQVNAPAVLHIATHGFFLDDAVISEAEARSRGLFIQTNQPGESDSSEIHIEDPLLRSGLAFAGANLRRSGDDDGILTAKEASGLNLLGTKLVVLSACDTGVGEIKNGEGVYGLRRALVLAGSETQVISLWPVSDEGTRDLMIEYYRGLKAGQGRSEALRQVQLKMISIGSHKHPYFWASFIQSGEWANLAGKR